VNARRSDGQTLVLFALVLTALIGFSALVVDIGFKYASERRYQAVADAASLAGAQDLQPVSRGSNPTTVDYVNARIDALRVVLDEMIGVGTAPTCATNIDIDNCELPGGQFKVSIRTPSPNCVDCVPARSVQVTIREDEHPVTFARLFGQTTWDLSRTSVAGLTNAPNYTIVALRPIKPRGGTAVEVRDIRLDGGTQVIVRHGDVGTNSNMDYASCRSLLDLDDGYNLYHYDSPPSWCDEPTGKRIGSMIPDPGYAIPAAPPPTYSNLVLARDTGAACQALVEGVLFPTTIYDSLFPRDHSGDIEWAKVKCYNPGTYNVQLTDGNNELTVLKPGLYYFNRGLDVQSNLIGGYVPTEPGVSLWFPRNEEFKQRNGALILNAGTKWGNPGGVEPATAPAMTGTTPNLKITVYVQPDPACQVVLPYNTACGDLANNTINLAGGTAMYLAGVQYAPSDNVKVTGNSSGDGYIGQIWGWTLYYRGSNTVINQEGLQPDGPGIMRIDTACSPGEPQATCN
jgi:hypothetical protein